MSYWGVTVITNILKIIPDFIDWFEKRMRSPEDFNHQDKQFQRKLKYNP